MNFLYTSLSYRIHINVWKSCILDFPVAGLLHFCIISPLGCFSFSMQKYVCTLLYDQLLPSFHSILSHLSISSSLRLFLSPSLLPFLHPSISPLSHPPSIPSAPHLSFLSLFPSFTLPLSFHSFISAHYCGLIAQAWV